MKIKKKTHLIIMSVELKIKTFLEEKSPEILKDYSLLKNQPISFINDLFSIFNNSIYGIEDPKINQIVIECLSLYQKVKKNKVSFSKHKGNILLNHNNWVKDGDFLSIEEKLFNPKLLVSETDNNEDDIILNIINFRKQELLEFLKSNQTLDISLDKKFNLENPLVSNYIKKLCLDQISAYMFEKINSDNLRLFAISKVNSEHPLAKEFKLNKKEVIFCYINMQEMDQPKISRTTSLFDSYEVKNHTVKNVFHKMMNLELSFIFEGKNLSVRLPVWTGTIVCENL